MDRFFWRSRSSLLSFIHLPYKQTYRFIGDFINLLSDGADRYDGLSGNGGVVKADDQIIIGQKPVFSYKEV